MYLCIRRAPHSVHTFAFIRFAFFFQISAPVCIRSATDPLAVFSVLYFSVDAKWIQVFYFIFFTPQNILRFCSLSSTWRAQLHKHGELIESVACSAVHTSRSLLKAMNNANMLNTNKHTLLLWQHTNRTKTTYFVNNECNCSPESGNFIIYPACSVFTVQHMKS